MSKKKILFITGTRADYGKLKSLVKAVELSDSFEAHIFVSGMHLLKIFGSTYDEVIKDGHKNVYIAHGLIHSEKMSVNLGNTITHLNGYVDNIKPDMIVVHGDRVDALAGAVVGAFNNIKVAHLEGGEVSGTIDESIRHAISKFAHLHFVSNQEAQKRLLQMGENAENIFVIGSPDIDIMMNHNLPLIDDVKKYYEINFNKYGIFMYHPVTTEYDHVGSKIKIVVDAIIKSEKEYVVIYPNNDLGSETILNEYSRLRDNKTFKIYPSLRFEYFLTLLKNADFIISNSSAGVREACIYGVPAIDIGTRQSSRYGDALKNIQHVTENLVEMLEAINNVNAFRIPESCFGTGDSTCRFMEIISDENIWHRKFQKQFVSIEGMF